MSNEYVYDFPFTQAEYQQRIEAVRESMISRGIDALIISDPANMCYVTGYDAWSFYVPQAVMLLAREPEPFWIGRESDQSGARITTMLPHDHILGYPEDYVQSTVKHPFDYIGQWLMKRIPLGSVIGTEMDTYYYSASCQYALEHQCKGMHLCDATNLVNWVKIIKSETELRYMKQAAQIVQQAMDVAVQTIRPGVRQNDAVAEIYRAQIRGTQDFGGDYTSIVPMIPTGKGSSAPHITWSDGLFRQGEGSIIEIAAACRHYHCPLARTVFLGTPPKRMEELAEAMVAGVDEVLAQIKPGRTGEEIEEIWSGIIRRWGFEKRSRLGYSIGLNFPPDWGEHTISIRPGDTHPLQPNMTFHIMPGIWLEEWGVEISEPIVITETGAERLTDYQRKLIVIPG